MSALLQRVPLGKGLSVCVILWGAMVMILGACNNYAGLAVTRTFLGLFECVITPGFAILTTSWYLRSEQTLKQGLYYSMSKSPAGMQSS
jgi:MFS family permease